MSIAEPTGGRNRPISTPGDCVGQTVFHIHAVLGGELSKGTLGF